jgi:dipeptidyl-peptidase-4
VKHWWLAAVAACLGSSAMAADAPPLTLERVFASPDLSGPQPQALKLSPDGMLVTLVRNRDDERERFDLWALDTSTGKQRMLLDSKAMSSGGELSEAEKMRHERDRTLTGKRGILQYDWSPDAKALLVPIDGELMLAARDGTARRLGVRDAIDPTISPKGTYLSFVRDGNLHVQPLAGGAAKRITPDGGGTVHWGEAEFVAQEEMDRRDGAWWSPDERYLAVERFDEAPVQVATRAAIGATGTRLYEQRYPAAGTRNVLVELHVMRPDGGGAVEVDLGADRDIYLARVNWAPDGSALYVQRQNRTQTVLDLLRVDPATGRSQVVFTERAAPKSWINLSNVFHVFADDRILWWSERDGHGHLYLFSGGKWTQVTRGAWEVASIVGVDEAGARVFFTGNRDGVLERHVYALDLARPGEPRRLTEPGFWNTATMDAGATRMIVTRSSRSQPPQTYLADSDGKRLAWISENAVTGAHPYAPYVAAHRPTTYGTTRAEDGTELHWQMITPPLEPGKRYPVFFQHYGGPHSQTVDRQWSGEPTEQAIVARGWIFFQLDNRGSANRGKAFEDAIRHAMGSVEVADQRAGAKYLATLPFVDAKRIATYGWSYGGYMTIKMLEADPGLYAAGVAGAPVTDWSLYDTHYTERYMGDPRTDAAAYAKAGAIVDALRINDPLLLLHGMADDNVFLENTTALVAKLQANDRRFEMMLYPGKTHGAVRELHPWLTMFDFLDRHVRNVASIQSADAREK